MVLSQHVHRSCQFTEVMKFKIHVGAHKAFPLRLRNLTDQRIYKVEWINVSDNSDFCFMHHLNCTKLFLALRDSTAAMQFYFTRFSQMIRGYWQQSNRAGFINKL
jgi:hypothetical protein